MIKTFDLKTIKKPDTLETQAPVENIKKEQEVKFVYLKGDPGPKGDPGDRRTDDEVKKLIEPLIPKAIPGPKGESYILTEQDKAEIASKIEPKIVDKIIEKTEVVKEKTLPPMDEMPNVLRDKLENLKKGEKLSIEAIDGLSSALKQLSKNLKTSSSPTGSNNSLGLLKGSVHTSQSKVIRFIDDETPSGTIDGVNTIFNIAKTPRAGSLKTYKDGSRQRVTEDYTFLGKTITFTIAPQVGEILLVDYRY